MSQVAEEDCGVEIKSDDDGDEDTTTLVIKLILLSMVFIISISVNVTILMAFYRKQSLRTISNSFTMNLLVINLLSTLVFLPLVTMDLVMSPISMTGQCLLSNAVAHLIASLSLLSTLLIAVDQYLAILYALRYHHHMTRLRSSLSIGSVWIISSVITTTTCINHTHSHLWSYCQHPADYTPPAYSENYTQYTQSAYSEDYKTYTQTGKSEDNTPYTQPAYSEDYTSYTLPAYPEHLQMLFSCVSTAITFLAPTLLMTVIYSRIYFEAHNSSERARKCSLKPTDCINNMTTILHLQTGPDEVQHPISSHRGEPPSKTSGRIRRSSTSSCIQKSAIRCCRRTSLPSDSLNFNENLGHIRHRISNAGQFIHREESKTAKIYIISLAAVIFCWSPLFIFRTVSHYITCPLPTWSAFIILWFCSFYAAISPFIFACRNKKVKAEILKIFSIKTKEDNYPSLPILPYTISGQSMPGSLSLNDTRKKMKTSKQLTKSSIFEHQGGSQIEKNTLQNIRFAENDTDNKESDNYFLIVSASTDNSARSSFSSGSTTVTRMYNTC